MAQHKSAEKRARTSKRKGARNAELKSRMRTEIKRIRASSDKAKATVDLKKTVKLLDKLASKGIIHRNNAANLKSKLTALVSHLQ